MLDARDETETPVHQLEAPTERLTYGVNEASSAWNTGTNGRGGKGKVRQITVTDCGSLCVVFRRWPVQVCLSAGQVRV